MGSGFSARGEGLLGSAIYGEPSPRTASLALNGPLGLLNLSAGAAYQCEPSISLEELTVSGGASTSIAFAGGRFGMARTIADSFAFLVPDKTIRRERVDAKSAGSSTIATSIAGHAALIPNLESYSASLVGIEMPESAPETSPSIPAVVLRPGYRSGTIIAVGARRSFLVRGRLLGPDGMPSASMIGDVSTASGKALGIATFTDDDGLFEVYGLTPGAYSIRWENGNSTDFSLGETELREVTIGDLLSEYPALSGSNALIGPSGERTKP